MATVETEKTKFCCDVFKWMVEYDKAVNYEMINDHLKPCMNMEVKDSEIKRKIPDSDKVLSITNLRKMILKYCPDCGAKL